MTIVEVKSTPTQRYFERKTKDELIQFIDEVRQLLGKSFLDLNDKAILAALPKSALARRALLLTRELPYD